MASSVLRATAARPNALESRRTCVLLSFTGGCVDTCTFIAVFGLFAAHVTGSLVLVGALFDMAPDPNMVGKLLALPVFFAGVMTTRWFVLRRETQGRASLVCIFSAQLFLLLAFMGTGLAFGPFLDEASPCAISTAMLGVLAMSIQSTAARLQFGKLGPSTVMTGNITQVAMDLVDVLSRPRQALVEARRIARLWPAIVAFTAGAIAAGFAYEKFGFVAICIPCVTVVLLLLQVRGAERFDAAPAFGEAEGATKMQR